MNKTPPVKQPWVRLQQANVTLGRVHALRDISLEIHEGERVALVGGNGSGKSSLLRVMQGLLLPQAGQVQRNNDVSQAFVFQRPFVMRASVLTNVALAAWLRRVPWAQAKEQACKALGDAGLQELAYRQARTLSGGQQQRVAFARALVCKPVVLLLDEPTASLSPHAKREVEDMMQRSAELGMTLVFASHNLGQVKRLASRVICLDAGQVVADCATNDFFNSPLPEAAMRFVHGEGA